METPKIAFVIGAAGAVVAVGLAYLMAAVTGDRVSTDELVRHALLTFVIASALVVAVRRRKPS